MGPPTACRAYLLRHGETEWNHQGKLQGQTDVPLNDKGRQQAEDAAGEIRKRQDEGSVPAFATIAASDLKRARDTAEAVARMCGTESVQTDARFRERSMGPGIEGLTWAELSGEQRHALRSGTPAGGESVSQLGARVVDGVLSTCRAHASPSCPAVLIVSHGGAMGQVLEHAAGGAPVPHVRNCGLYALTVRFPAGGAPPAWSFDGVVYEPSRAGTQGGERTGG